MTTGKISPAQRAERDRRAKELHDQWQLGFTYGRTAGLNEAFTIGKRYVTFGATQIVAAIRRAAADSQPRKTEKAPPK